MKVNGRPKLVAAFISRLVVSELEFDIIDPTVCFVGSGATGSGVSADFGVGVGVAMEEIVGLFSGVEDENCDPEGVTGFGSTMVIMCNKDAAIAGFSRGCGAECIGVVSGWAGLGTMPAGSVGEDSLAAFIPARMWLFPGVGIRSEKASAPPALLFSRSSGESSSNAGNLNIAPPVGSASSLRRYLLTTAASAFRLSGAEDLPLWTAACCCRINSFADSVDSDSAAAFERDDAPGLIAGVSGDGVLSRVRAIMDPSFSVFSDGE